MGTGPSLCAEKVPHVEEVAQAGEPAAPGDAGPWLSLARTHQGSRSGGDAGASGRTRGRMRRLVSGGSFACRPLSLKAGAQEKQDQGGGQ